MTKKQIITDGCEFQSDCIEYKDISYLKIMPICAIHELSIACRDKVNKCKYYTLYKQLKRKEQEFEELKEDRERWKSNFNGKVSAIEELLQQLDQLKAENETYKKMLDDTEVKVALIDVRTGDRELWRNLGMKADKLKQTLAEIKKIAENVQSFVGRIDIEDDVCEQMEQILQKISEVEDEHNG